MLEFVQFKQEGLERKNKGKHTHQVCYTVSPKGTVTKRKIKTQKDYRQAHQAIRCTNGTSKKGNDKVQRDCHEETK